MELVPKQFAWAGHANWLFSSYTEDVSFWSVLGTLSTLEALFATMRYINWHLHLHLCPEGNINIYLWQTTLCHRAAVCRWQDPSQCTNVCPRLTTHSCPSMTWSLGDGAVIEQELCWNSDRCQTSKYQSVSQCLWYNYKNNSDNNKTRSV